MLNNHSFQDSINAATRERLLNFRSLCPNNPLPFYRTGSPHYWEKEDILHLRRHLGITHYYDLRTEIEQHHCRYCRELKENPFIQHVSMPIDLTGDSFFDTPNASALDYANFYLRMLPQAMKVAEHLFVHAQSMTKDEKILFGCAAGKDRTGLVAMILLKKYGIEDAWILEDYMKSFYTEKDILKHFYTDAFKNKITPEAFVASMQPKQSTLEIILNHIHTHQLL